MSLPDVYYEVMAQEGGDFIVHQYIHNRLRPPVPDRYEHATNTADSLYQKMCSMPEVKVWSLLYVRYDTMYIAPAGHEFQTTTLAKGSPQEIYHTLVPHLIFMKRA